MDLKELILQSWTSLQRNRLRSVLTMMGIVWGLTTVVLLLGYGESVTKGIVNAFMGIGNNVIMIWEGQTSMQAGGQRAGKRIHYKYEDLQAIRDEAPLVRAVSAEWDDRFSLQVWRQGALDFHEGRSVSVSRDAQADRRRRPLLRRE